MTRVLAWWRGLPPGARWGLLAAVVLVALVVVAELWGALVVGLGALVGVVAGRTPANPAAAAAARQARAAREASREAVRAAAVHHAEVVTAPARDREADRAIAAAAQAAAAAPVTGRPVETPEPDFLRRVRERGGQP